MNEDGIKLLQNRAALLENEVRHLRDENKRLKQINRRLQGKQHRRGAPSKVINILDLFGTVPDVMNKNLSAPRLVREGHTRLAEFLGELSDKSMANAIYKLRKKIVEHEESTAAQPMSSEELEVMLKDLM